MLIKTPAPTELQIPATVTTLVQTRAMKVKEGKPQKPLKVTTIHGLDIGPEQLIEQQKTDQPLTKYWELAENPVENGKAQFFIKNQILHRKYIGKHSNSQ